jgi:hypothetical protein
MKKNNKNKKNDLKKLIAKLNREEPKIIFNVPAKKMQSKEIKDFKKKMNLN